MEGNGTRYYQIGELSNSLELSPRTIRYYEEIGLLDSIKRIEGTRRVYTDKDLQRLKFVKRLKDLGLTLSEMLELGDIYQIHRTNRKVLPRLLELLNNHMGKIDEQIHNLNRLKEDILNYQERIHQKLNMGDDRSD
jgi:DNA-binding transcriptional MerR regulator